MSEELDALESAAETMERAARALARIPQSAVDVLQERWRQIGVEGYTVEHDDVHACGELAAAASAYAVAAADQALLSSLKGEREDTDFPPPMWPCAWEFKPSDPRRMLVKAGALILAEIERLDRIEAAKCGR